MVRLIKRQMNVETDIRVVWVSEGEAQEATIREAPAWIKLPVKMPPYGSEAFRKLRIDMFLRKSFLEQSPFDEVSMGIAHELSHLVLDSINHPLRGCEKAVDLTAMMLGFRSLFVTGIYKEMRLKDHIAIRQLGYLTPEEVRQADQIIGHDQNMSRTTRPQPAFLEHLNKLLSKSWAYRAFGENLINRLSKWRLPALAFLSVPSIVLASCLVWAYGWLPPRQTGQHLADQTASINPRRPRVSKRQIELCKFKFA
jgi:hypothetical protein